MTRYIDIEYYLLSTIYYLLSKLVDNKGINLNGEGKEPMMFSDAKDRPLTV